MSGKLSRTLLELAYNALFDAERGEAEEQAKLTALEEQERRLQEELERAKAALGATQTPETLLAARAWLQDLSRTRETLVRQTAAQRQVVRQRHEQIQTARNAYEEVQRRATALKDMIRQEEQTLVQWQRQVSEAEEQLARCHQMLAEVQARLERVREEFAKLAGA